MFLWVVPLSRLLTLGYQLIVKSSCALELIDAYYSWGPSSRSISERIGETTPEPHPYLGLGQSSHTPQIKILIQFLFCSTLECYHLYIKIIMGIAHHPMNSWCSDTSLHHYSFLGSRVVITGLSTSES